MKKKRVIMTMIMRTKVVEVMKMMMMMIMMMTKVMRVLDSQLVCIESDKVGKDKT
jgi:hypothetical protein